MLMFVVFIIVLAILFYSAPLVLLVWAVVTVVNGSDAPPPKEIPKAESFVAFSKKYGTD